LQKAVFFVLTIAADNGGHFQKLPVNGFFYGGRKMSTNELKQLLETLSGKLDRILELLESSADDPVEYS